MNLKLSCVAQVSFLDIHCWKWSFSLVQQHSWVHTSTVEELGGWLHGKEGPVQSESDKQDEDTRGEEEGSTLKMWIINKENSDIKGIREIFGREKNVPFFLSPFKMK